MPDVNNTVTLTALFTRDPSPLITSLLSCENERVMLLYIYDKVALINLYHQSSSLQHNKNCLKTMTFSTRLS